MSTDTQIIPRREAQPDGSVRVYFGKPILFHTDVKSFVTLRPPKVGEIWEFGDPIEYVVQDGAATPYVDRKALVRWIRALMTDHDADMIGRDGDTALGLLIEDVVLGFFTSARMRLTQASVPLPSAA